MKKYIIAIEENIVEEFEIEANNYEEALAIATEKYRKGELTLCPGKVQFKQMAVIKPNCESTEWIEF